MKEETAQQENDTYRVLIINKLEKSFFSRKKRPYRKLVSLEAEATNHSSAGTGNERVVAIFLAGKDIGDVDLHHGCRDGKEGVAQGYGGVAVATEVDDEAVAGETCLLDAVDEFTLDIALIVADFHVGEQPTEAVDNFLQGGGTVDLGLATTGEVKVWTVDDFYMFHDINNAKAP